MTDVRIDRRISGFCIDLAKVMVRSGLRQVKNKGKGFQKNRLIAVVLLFCLALPVCIYGSPGECALDFLNIPVGAYTASMGQANYAGTVGPEAIFGNPSRLGQRTGGFASYQMLLLDTRSEAFALGLSLGENYTLGIGIHILEPGEIIGYTPDDIKTGNVNAGDYLIRLGLSSQGALAYGFSLSYYRQQLDDRIGNGLGFGFGITGEIGSGTLAITGDNIGPNFKIEQSSYPLPQRYSISGWFPLSNNYVNLNVDLTYNRAFGFRGSAGIEYSPVSGFFVRAGSNIDIPLSVGLGINRKNLAFDYSYIPSDLFGNRQIFSVSILH